jgi:hypothetical protein
MYDNYRHLSANRTEHNLQWQPKHSSLDTCAVPTKPVTSCMQLDNCAARSTPLLKHNRVEPVPAPPCVRGESRLPCTDGVTAAMAAAAGRIHLYQLESSCSCEPPILPCIKSARAVLQLAQTGSRNTNTANAAHQLVGMHPTTHVLCTPSHTIDQVIMSSSMQVWRSADKLCQHTSIWTHYVQRTLLTVMLNFESAAVAKQCQQTMPG